MAIPVITSLSPNVGRSLGDSFLQISGSNFGLPSAGMSIRVFFDNVEALKADVITSTKIFATTPPGNVGVVDVRVENITPGVSPAPDIVEPVTLPNAYTYERPDISTGGTIGESYSPIALVGRRLVEELRRTVLENTYWAMNIEYADLFSAASDEAKNASAPALKISGPSVTRDRFYSSNSPHEVITAPGSYDIIRRPFSVALTFDYVGIGRTKGESINLFNSLQAYFDRTPFLNVFSNGVDDTDGIVRLEMAVIWPQLGRFNSRAGRQSIYEFQGAFQVRGVWLFAEKTGEMKENLNISFTPEQF